MNPAWVLLVAFRRTATVLLMMLARLVDGEVRRSLPARVLLVQVGNACRRAGPLALALGAVPELPGGSGTAAVVVWDRARRHVLRYLLPRKDAAAILGTPDASSDLIADALFARGSESISRKHILGAAHNHMDVTAALRPWFPALSATGSGATAATVGALVGRGHATRHVVELLWDDLSLATYEGAELILAPPA